jgi:predicted nucleotidyltransferase component of viral defense system
LIDVYGFAEIWAEKVRSLLQRSEPRDLYDLHQLLEDDPSLPAHAQELFRRKAIAKAIDPDGS